MDATEMFLIRHGRMHAHVERLPEGLDDRQIRARVHPAVNPLAWLLWHMARAEDSTINLLIVDRPQILDSGWGRRLHVSRRDVGTGMTAGEVDELSAQVHLASLMEYWRAVGTRTADVVDSLSPADLDEIVDPERIHRFAAQTAAEPARAGLEHLWQDITKGHFLVWLPLTHNAEHVGQAEVVRGLLGHPGRF